MEAIYSRAAVVMLYFPILTDITECIIGCSCRTTGGDDKNPYSYSEHEYSITLPFVVINTVRVRRWWTTSCYSYHLVVVFLAFVGSKWVGALFSLLWHFAVLLRVTSNRFTEQCRSLATIQIELKYRNRCRKQCYLPLSWFFLRTRCYLHCALCCYVVVLGSSFFLRVYKI